MRSATALEAPARPQSARLAARWSWAGWRQRRLPLGPRRRERSRAPNGPAAGRLRSRWS